MARSFVLSLGAAFAALSQAAAAPVDMKDATLACEGDVLRLCAAHVPDHQAIIGCMQQRHAELSARCATVFDAGMKTGTQKALAGD